MIYFNDIDTLVVVTNWSATRVFANDGTKLLQERFHNKRSEPKDTHKRVCAELRYAKAMERAEMNKKYFGD